MISQGLRRLADFECYKSFSVGGDGGGGTSSSSSDCGGGNSTTSASFFSVWDAGGGFFFLSSMRCVFSFAALAGLDWFDFAVDTVVVAVEDEDGFVVEAVEVDVVVAVVFCEADVVAVDDEVVGFVVLAVEADAFLFSLVFFVWVEEAGNFLLANCQLTSSIDTNFFSRSKYWL